jgi:hypothetical protein
MDRVHAENALKANTLTFLHNEIEKRRSSQVRISASSRRLSYAITLASFALILFSGVLSFNLYYTPYAYIDIDVNPSIELTVNRFDRVIGNHAYNSEGEDILKSASVKHKRYHEAVDLLIGAMIQYAPAQGQSLVSVTLQTDNAGTEQAMLSAIESAVRQHHSSASVDAFSVGGDVRETAYGMNLSPAKYLAIQDLIEADPTATVEGCREHTISELRRMTAEHHSDAGGGVGIGGDGSGHHGAGAESGSSSGAGIEGTSVTGTGGGAGGTSVGVTSEVHHDEHDDGGEVGGHYGLSSTGKGYGSSAGGTGEGNGGSTGGTGDISGHHGTGSSGFSGAISGGSGTSEGVSSSSGAGATPATHRDEHDGYSAATSRRRSHDAGHGGFPPQNGMNG